MSSAEPGEAKSFNHIRIRDVVPGNDHLDELVDLMRCQRAEDRPASIESVKQWLDRRKVELVKRQPINDPLIINLPISKE